LGFESEKISEMAMEFKDTSASSENSTPAMVRVKKENLSIVFIFVHTFFS